MALPPPDYSLPKPSRPAHINASASSSRSSSRARRRPKAPSRQNTENSAEDAFFWSPSPPMDEKTKLPSQVAIEFPKGDLICLVTPPKVDPLGEEDWGDRGRDGRLAGVVTVYSHKRKVFPQFILRLIGTQRLSYSVDCTTPHEDTEVFRREIELDGSEEEDGDVVIERGISTYKFSIRVPASSALSDRCKNGRIIYYTTATLVGSGSMFKPDITARKESWVMCNPQDEERMLQYQNHQEGISDLLGPYALGLTSSEFLVGAALGVTLTLAYPPKTLTIFAFQVCIQQTIQLSRTPKDKVVEIKGTKKVVFAAGPTSGFASKDFAEKTRKSGPVVFDGRKEGVRDEEGGWMLREMGRLPNDDDIRPTTLPGTKTSMRFRSDLIVEVVCQHTGPEIKDEGVKIVTMLKEEDVFLTSCICMLDRISLPSYTRDDQPSELQPDGSARALCRCLEQWDSLRQHEILAQKVDPESESVPRGWVEDSKDDSGAEERRGRWDGVGKRGVGQSAGGRRKIGETYGASGSPR